MIGVTENFREIQDLLSNAATEAGRDPESVRLLAASKTQSPQVVREAAASGQREFGENYVQEGLDKIEACRELPLVWHFIGHLQSNKTRAVAEHFDWVHTVDRLKIARRLNDQRPHYADDLNVCIQVNIDGESGKAGIDPEETPALAQQLSELPRLRLRGLMCIPAIRVGLEAQREPFARMRQLLDVLQQSGLSADTLSMGMTGDYAAAIMEGATIVRIGTALFGPRASAGRDK